MPLSSMTGFSSVSGGDDALRWTWELKSVNGRGLDIRVRLPTGFDGLEAPARAALGGRFTRGTISAQLMVQSAATQPRLSLDEAVLERAIEIANTVRERVGGAPVSAESLLAIRGVLISEDPATSDEALAARHAEMLASLKQGAGELATARAAEGQALHGVIRDLIATIGDLRAQIEGHPSRSPDAIAARLTTSVSRLLDAVEGKADLDRARLHQEAAMIATRADVEEELKRLDAHVEAARELLSASEPVGRRLDFLAQEFNREANTICSKSIDAEVSRLGLELKATIDRMREQVQNVE